MFSASSLITAARTALWEVIRKHFCSYRWSYFPGHRGEEFLANQNPVLFTVRNLNVKKKILKIDIFLL